MKWAASVGVAFPIVLAGVIVAALLVPLSLQRAKAQAAPCTEIADKAKTWLDQSENYFKMGSVPNIQSAGASAAISTA